MGSWAVEAFPEGANYFVLEGVPGLSVVTERNEGFDAIVSAVGNFTKVGAQTANWSTDEGRAVTAAALEANDNDIQFIFAQNDEMGIGAAQAVRDAGLVPGTDVKIATIDGTTGALEALAAGDLSFVAQYNPFFGDVVFDVVTEDARGQHRLVEHQRRQQHVRLARGGSGRARRPVSASETGRHAPHARRAGVACTGAPAPRHAYGTSRRAGPTYWLSGRISELALSCSITCAVQPVTRLATNSGVKVGVSKPMRWYAGPVG